MKPLIIIDPGHGGSDPGASANGMMEKDYTLMISLYQYKRFQELEIPVAITRDVDSTLGNVKRAEIVKNSGAKYCISNHINAAASTSAQGVEAIHSIYNDGKLAHAIVEALAAEGMPKRATPVYCRQYPSDPKKDYYYMHRWTGAVQTNIIEYDFITNVQGAQRIKDNWRRYAEAVVKAYCNFVGLTYRAPIALQEDAVLKWAKQQGYDISKAAEVLTYRDVWEILYQLQGGKLHNEEKVEVDKEEVKEEVNRPVLRRGSTGNEVKLLQQLLGITADGSFGPQTEAVVKEYQKKNGLVADGIVGHQTWATLLLYPVPEIEPVGPIKDKYKYYVEGATHIVEIDPLELKLLVGSMRGVDVKDKNYINASFVWWEDYPKNTKPYATSMLIYDGKIISNKQPNGYWEGPFKGKGVPTPTFIIYKDGRVIMKDTNDLSSEAKDIHLAVSVVECCPAVRQQGFAPYVAFSSVGYQTNRIGIAYRKKDNKILLIHRPNTDINRFNQTMKNLGADFGGSLDSGGSANFLADGKKINVTTRWMYAGITW